MLKLKTQQWAHRFSECVRCKRSAVKHKAKGYCKSCYGLVFGDKEKRREWNRKYKSTHPVKNYRTGFIYPDPLHPQSANCEICHKECKTVLDHDHNTGKFRGWLCMQCNVSLGAVKDKIEILHKMIEYLVKNL